jgi:hypothetical protein
MNLKEIKQLDNVKLVSAFYWIAVKTTNEVNSRRGLTKQTDKQEEWLIQEMSSRFELPYSELKKELDK